MSRWPIKIGIKHLKCAPVLAMFSQPIGTRVHLRVSGAAVLALGRSDNGCVQPDRDLALRVAETTQLLARR